MFNSRMIDVAVGLVFVYAVATGLSSVVTEFVARLSGLRARYLLQGLRELLDQKDAVATYLPLVQGDYVWARQLVTGQPVEESERPKLEAAKEEAERAKGASAKPSITGALLGSPVLDNQGLSGTVAISKLRIEPNSEKPRDLNRISGPSGEKWAELRRLPSYIPSRSFAAAVLNLLIPSAEGRTSMDGVADAIKKIPDSPLKSSLTSLAKTSQGRVDVFVRSVEQWYDDHMARVSGWYKRYVSRISFVFGAILVVGLNLNTLTIGRTLYTDNDVRSTLSSFAARTAACPAGQDQGACLKDLASTLSGAADAGLPIGWATVSECAAPKSGCNWLDRRGIFSRSGGSVWEVLLVVGGLLLTIIALVPGSRFWFDAIGRLGSLRSSGPKPPTAPT